MKVGRKNHLKTINSEVYMKNERLSHLTVYCARKWDDFWLQTHYLKHLSRPTLDEKCIGSGTTMGQRVRTGSDNDWVLSDLRGEPPRPRNATTPPS